MKKSLPRICIASTGGGTGKTLISLGLARAFLKTGIQVKPFKKGPDFIDARWLSVAAKNHAANLDPFFSTPEEIKKIFCRAMQKMGENCLGLIEGNRGLFDGLNETGSCSTAQIARILNCPIILCIDCHKATRTIAAIIKGLLEFEKDLIFAGLILNRIGSERHATSLVKAISANCQIPILGTIPRLKDNIMPERHMGLATSSPEPDQNTETILEKFASIIQKHCDLEAIYQKATNAPMLNCPPIVDYPSYVKSDAQPKIGIVRDNALWFYYLENIEALRQAGASTVFISLLDQSTNSICNWLSIDGLYLGGGFPEDYLPQICKSPFFTLLRQYSRSAMPIYAECGGMVLLAKTFAANGKKWPLASIIPCEIVWNSQPQGLGYVEGSIISANPWYPEGMSFRGHEFHYSACVWAADAHPEVVLNLERGQGIIKINGQNMDGFIKENTWASYSHIYAPEQAAWAVNFVRLATAYKKKAAENR